MKKKFKIGYKLLTRHGDGNLYSFNASNTDRGRSNLNCVRYIFDGEWVYPKLDGSKLFVFDTVENALLAAMRWGVYYNLENRDAFSRDLKNGEFSLNNPNFKDLYRLHDSNELYICECDGFDKIDRVSTCSEENDKLVSIWKNGYMGIYNREAPDGSYGAKRIRLTSRIL